jgi:ketosteroid isomerase-like protein
MNRFIAAGLPALLLLSACAPQGAKNDPSIVALDAQFEKAFGAKDAAAVAALYADDARVMAPNAATAQGQAAAKDAFEGMIKSGLGLKLANVEAVSAGNLGHAVGTYTVTGPDGAVIDTGKYMETVRKTDGAWKITNDIWNSDAPPPALPVMVATHHLKDRAHWLSVWQDSPERREMFAKNGAAAVHLIQSTSDEDTTGLVIEVADMDKMKAFLGSPGSRDAAAADGVDTATLQFFSEIK